MARSNAASFPHCASHPCVTSHNDVPFPIEVPIFKLKKKKKTVQIYTLDSHATSLFPADSHLIPLFLHSKQAETSEGLMIEIYLNSTSTLVVSLGSAKYLHVNIQKNKCKNLKPQNPLLTSFQLSKTPDLGCLKGKDSLGGSIAKKYPCQEGACHSVMVSLQQN